MTRIYRLFLACALALTVVSFASPAMGSEDERCTIQPFEFAGMPVPVQRSGNKITWEARGQTEMVCPDGAPEQIQVWERASTVWRDRDNDGNADLQARTAHRVFDMEQELNYTFRDRDGVATARCNEGVCEVEILIEARGNHGSALNLHIAGTLDVQNERWTSLEALGGYGIH